MVSFACFVVTTFLLLSSCRAEPVEKCPRTCTCNRFSDTGSGTEVRIDCLPLDEKLLGSVNHIPDDLPPDLTWLMLDKNVIDHLSPNAFSNFPKLKTLSLRGNKIKSIDRGTFAGLRQLTSLDLSGNGIETIDITAFKDLPKLVSLNLEKNKLQTISPFVQFPALTELNLSFNNFTDCTIPPEIARPKLQSLSLSGSACTSISSSSFESLASCKLLTKLTFSNTQVTKIEKDTFVKLESLEELDLSNNKLLDWTVLQQITYPPRLKRLSLENLKNVHSVLNTAYIDFLPVSLDMLRISGCGFNGTMPNFRHLTNLTFLYIEGNDFTELPDVGTGASGFPPSIEHIFARNNKILSVRSGAFAGLRNLQTLDLSFSNRIKPFSPNAFGRIAPSVTELLLSQALGEFPKGLLPALPNLQRLILDENEFEKLDIDVINDFDKLAKLEKLDLTGNKLYDLPPNFFKKMTSLTQLYLNDNFLGKRISEDVNGHFFSGLSSITLIDLEENDMGDLPPKLFSQTGTNVKTLSLLGNRLTKVPAEAVAGFSNLRILNLDGNDIRVLSVKDCENLPTGCIVDLWSNPIDCSCDNYEFFRWMEQTKSGTNRPSIKELECRTPSELNGRPPPPSARMTASCANSAGSTAVIVFLVVICMIVFIVLVAWFGARKLRHYFPYKRLQTASRQGNPHLVTAVPGVNMSGLDDTEETFQM